MRGPEYLIFPLAAACLWILVRGIRRRESRFGITVKLGTAAYVAAVSAIAFFPLPVQRGLLDFERQMQFMHDQFAPFGSIGPALTAGLGSREMLQALANMAMFVPVGMVVPLLTGADRALRRTVVVATAGGIAIEVGQFAVSRLLGFTYRVTDIDDVILYIVGAVAGYGLFRLVGPLFLNRVDRDEANDRVEITP